MRRHADLRAAVAAAIACAALALLLPFGWLRLVFAAPLALLLPGYAIAAVTFVRRPLGRPQLLLMSLALSLMTLALSGLLLNYAPGGVRAGSWALLLVAVVIAGSLAAARRRGPGPSWQLGSVRRPRVTAVQAVLGLLGLALAVGALVLAFATLPAKNALGYTQLWMLPRADGVAGVRIGVASDEQQQQDYRLRVAFGNRAKPIERQLSLAPGESRILRLDTAQPAKGEAVPVYASLFRQDQPGSIYRRVSGWVPARKASR